MYAYSTGCEQCPDDTDLTEEPPQSVKPTPNLLSTETVKDTPQL